MLGAEIEIARSAMLSDSAQVAARVPTAVLAAMLFFASPGSPCQDLAATPSPQGATPENPVNAPADYVDSLFEMPLDELMAIEVTSASSLSESLRDAPAAMVVLTQQDIQQRGYSDLAEVLADLPGFDTVTSNGTDYIVSYQRGYRTPFIQRTLLVVNGVIDNSLWAHAAVISRQYPLSNIARIEVLYGPAGAIYGPNAFLGVINIFTKDARKLGEGEHHFVVNAEAGSFDTRAADLAASGRLSELGYSISAKAFKSDEADLGDYAKWGYADASWLRNRAVWGPVLDQQHNGIRYGEYADRSREFGVIGELTYKNTSLGLIRWENREGYGMQYAFDHAQPNQSWNHDSFQVYLKNEQQAREDFSIKSLLKYRTSRIWGGWAEAYPDTGPAPALSSYVSISDWNSDSRSWEFRQDYDWLFSDTLRFTAGIKYEHKEPTKAYDVCNYYASSFCSSGDSGPGPHGLGPGIFLSSDPTIILGPGTLPHMPASNLTTSQDKGAFLQAFWDQGDWRLGSAVRVDQNSNYGTFVKPRASAIYRVSDNAVVKLLYGEAFQEPSPLHLYGGYQGRDANPDLQPEEVRNLEAIFMYQQPHWLHDMSLFAAHYQNVIKEEAENAGERRIFGFEYRGKYQFANFIRSAADISGYVYYTYTRSKSSIYYDHVTGEWVDGWRELGDIAPHKINLGINVPVSDRFGVHLRTNWVSDRELYLRNPLRAEGREIDSYVVFDLNLRYRFEHAALAFKINNLFDQGYYQPGIEQADSGDEFFDGEGNPQRAPGFRNSLLPQVGRHFMLTLSVDL
jgi:iron complex outermembrane receptor protein